MIYACIRRGLRRFAFCLGILVAAGAVAQFPGLQISLPASAGESSGTLTNAGLIKLGGVFSTNVTVVLNASPASQVTLPAEVVVTAGRTSAAFDLVVLDNSIADGNRMVTISGAAPGWDGGQVTIKILDDDPAALQLTTVPSPQFTGVGFTNRLLALDVNGQQLGAGGFTVQLTIESPAGTNTLGHATITNGQCNLTLTSTVPVMSGQLVAEGRGLRVASDPFNILQSLACKLPGPVRDAAWNIASEVLYASVPEGAATNGGTIVTVDTRTGAMTSWAPVPNGISSSSLYDGRLTMSPDGQTLFVTAGYGNQIQQWDVGVGALRTNYNLPTGQFVVDMAASWATPWRLAIIPGQTNSSPRAMLLNELLVPQSTTAGTPLRSIIADPVLPETFYYFRPYQIAEWKTGAAGVLSERTLRDGPYPEAALPMTVDQGRLFVADGCVVDLGSAKSLGTMAVPTILRSGPKAGLVVTDASRHQVIVASPAGLGVTRLQSFDSSDLQIRRDVLVPLSLNNPKRLLFCGSNVLAIVASNALGLVRWPVAPAGAGAVDLAVSPSSLTPNPIIRADCDWSVAVTNRGASDASDVRLRVILPSGAAVVRSASNAGRVWSDASSLQVWAAALPAGSNMVVSFTISNSIGGWTTNLFTVTANEDEARSDDNQTTVVDYVAPSGVLGAVDTLRLQVKEMVYAPQSGLAYALERTTATNATLLFRLDSKTLQPQVLRILPGVATHLRISGDEHFLYATDEGGRGALRVDLTGTEPDLQFETFNAAGGYPFKFIDMEVDPGDSRALVALARSAVQSWTAYQTTAAYFRNGVKLPRTADFVEYTSTPASLNSLEIDARTRTAVLARNDLGHAVRFLKLEDNGLQFVGGYRHDVLPGGFTIINGRVYTRTGDELVLETGRRLRSLPSLQTGTGLLNWEPQSDRVVLSMGGSGGRVQVFDRLTLGRLGDFALGAVGVLDSSVLLPGGRLALGSESNLVFVTRQSLIEGTVPTDLLVHTSFSSLAPKVGESLLITLTISNAGPSSAVAPVVTFESPSDFVRDSAIPVAPLGAGNGVFPYPLVWTSPALAPGQSRVFQVQGHFTYAGSMLLAGGVADRAVDPLPTNNRVETILPATYSLAAGQAGWLGLQVTDAAYDAPRNRILATAKGDSPLSGQLVAIAPESGMVQTNWTIGAGASVMALADDGRTLYVATDGGTNLAKIDLVSMQIQGLIPVAPDATTFPITAVKLCVNPGSPDQVIASRSDGQLAFYSNGAFQPPTYSYGYDFAFFAPNRLLTPKSAFPFTLDRYAVAGSSLQLDETGGPIQIEGLRAALNLIFARDGRLVDPFALTQIGLFSAFGSAAVDPASELVFYPAHNSALGLHVFDLRTQTLLREETFGSAGDTLSDLFLAGTNLIAARGASGRLAIMRSVMVPAGAPSDLAVAVASEGPWQVGKLSQWSITVTNVGPNPASATHVLMRLPDGMVFVDANVAALSAVEPGVDLLLGDLPAGGSSEITVRALPQTPSFGAELVVSTRSNGADPDMTSNVARLTLPIESCKVENRVGYFSLNAADLTYDPVGLRLFLSCPDLQPGTNNALVVIDPARGTWERQISLPGRPAALAVSPGGEFLYAELDGGAQIIRLSLPGLETNLLFKTVPVGGPSCSMVVLPDSPGTLVLSRFGGGTPSPAGVWVYDDGVPRSTSVPGGYGGVTFIRSALDSTNLIALDYTTGKFRLIRVSPAGLSLESVVGDPVSTSYSDFSVGGTNLVVGSQIYDRASFRSKVTLPVSFSPEVTAISSTGDCVVFAAASNRAQDPIDWAGFRTDTFALVGSTRSPGIPYGLRKCVLWGSDGVAAIGNGYLYLGRFDFAGTPFGDSDQDGVPDKWEMAHGLDPAVSDAAADPDSDGASNLTEYLAGSDPRSAAEVFRVVMSRFTNNRLRLFFHCGAGHSYRVERSIDLKPENWITLTNGISNGGCQVYDAGIAPANSAYYRVHLTP